MLRVELAEDERAASRVRRATRAALNRWWLPGLVDTVVRTVSELVTNATRHGLPPVSIGLEQDSNQVRLDVYDASPTEPGAGAQDPYPESGRGLAIVQALADEVAVEQGPGDGKVIHVSFGTPRADGE